MNEKIDQHFTQRLKIAKIIKYTKKYKENDEMIYDESLENLIKEYKINQKGKQKKRMNEWDEKWEVAKVKNGMKKTNVQKYQFIYINLYSEQILRRKTASPVLNQD